MCFTFISTFTHVKMDQVFHRGYNVTQKPHICILSTLTLDPVATDTAVQKPPLLSFHWLLSQHPHVTILTDTSVQREEWEGRKD